VSAMNLPNSLTVLRIFFVPLLVVVLLTRQPNFDFWGLPIHFEVWGVLILLMAAATDVMDGYIARKRREITTLGILLDPIADKLLISAAFISLVQMGLVPAWMVVIIIGRAARDSVGGRVGDSRVAIRQDENDFAGAGRLRGDSDGEVYVAEAARHRADVAGGVERRGIGDSLLPDVLEPDR
jgi:hypothetical protein